MTALIILATLFFLATFFLPWVNNHKIRNLYKDIKSLEEEIEDLKLSKTSHLEKREPEREGLKHYTVKSEQPETITEDVSKETTKPWGGKESQVGQPKQSKKPKNQRQPAQEKLSWEQRLGTRFPVWIGGIAMAFAGIFLVKYSIENNLVSPELRVFFGVILGAVLIYSAHWIRQRPDFANGERISQSITGAGIIVLYASIFAASSLYELIPSVVGFMGMAVVTAIAIYMSLLYGMPIAILGMLGGFLTPALIAENDPSIATLFVYLYCIFVGLMAVIRRNNWWGLSIPLLFLTFLWVLFGLDNYSSEDSLWFCLFLGAIGVTVVMSSWSEENSAECSKSRRVFSYMGLAGVLLLMAGVVGTSKFGFFEWSFMWLLALGTMLLAWGRPLFYRVIPWFSLALSFAMFVTWTYQDLDSFIRVVSAFAIIYVAGGYALMFKTNTPLLFARIFVVSSFGFFLLFWSKLHDMSVFISADYFWGIMPLALSAVAIQTLSLMRDKFDKDRDDYEPLKTAFAIMATGFLSLAFFIILDREWLSVAIAGQILGTAWVSSRVSVASLPRLTLVLLGGFGFLLIPQIILLFQISAYSLVELKLHIQKTVPMVEWPLFQLGLPAVLFISSSRLLLKDTDSKLVRWLERSAVLLVAIMGYYLTRHLFHVEENILFTQAGFMERGVVTNVLFAYGLGCLWAGRYYTRITFSKMGMILCSVAIFRVVYFDLLTHNPLWEHQAVGKWVGLNALILPYLIPIFCIFRMVKERVLLDLTKWNGKLYGLSLLLAFVFVSFEVRHFFHGEFLDRGDVTNAEIYSYSVMWLLFGIALLTSGIKRKDKMLRYASLAVISLTVGKVFIYDASELEGLYRIFSFFGLGLCLMGLSYFYSKFVFVRDKVS